MLWYCNFSLQNLLSSRRIKLSNIMWSLLRGIFTKYCKNCMWNRFLLVYWSIWWLFYDLFILIWRRWIWLFSYIMCFRISIDYSCLHCFLLWWRNFHVCRLWYRWLSCLHYSWYYYYMHWMSCWICPSWWWIKMHIMQWLCHSMWRRYKSIRMCSLCCVKCYNKIMWIMWY